MQASSVGRSPSAETDAMADTVTPNRPASPSVVTTFTVHAAALMPARKRSRKLAGISIERAASAIIRLLSRRSFGGRLHLRVEPLADGAVAGRAADRAEHTFG